MVAFNINSAQKKVVVINASHGGVDWGITYDSINEKELVLNISQYLSSINDAHIKFVGIRNTDDYISLNDRISKVDSIHPDLVITLHVAQDLDIRKSGVVVSVGKNNESDTSKQYGNKILNGFKSQKFGVNDSITTADTYFMNNVKEIPSVLIELGYLSNEKDRKALINSTTKEQIAKAITAALQ
ncbi:hypothetical protein NBRC110019_30350 [Neptunitalea chrysea]|uniref:N-acetylmuramoyl-L-alanine amidase n=1 Tax=Neptunitalea chrysea TaxID=1647581 RepID=A0A9W6B755_9FLAO|nr:hypothetical protein NBRC110019_30350 [Neptunitalea chrysea]